MDIFNEGYKKNYDNNDKNNKNKMNNNSNLNYYTITIYKIPADFI